jgi:hypothetical protein
MGWQCPAVAGGGGIVFAVMTDHRPRATDAPAWHARAAALLLGDVGEQAAAQKARAALADLGPAVQ